MKHISAVALFAEDVREERSGQTTLVGLFGDRVEVPQLPTVMPRLSIYVRIHFDLDLNPGEMRICLKTPEGQEEPAMVIEGELVKTAIEEAKVAGTPLVGLISYTTMSPFAATQAGRLTAILRGDDLEIIMGSISFSARQPQSDPAPAKQD